MARKDSKKGKPREAAAAAVASSSLCEAVATYPEISSLSRGNSTTRSAATAVSRTVTVDAAAADQVITPKTGRKKKSKKHQNDKSPVRVITPRTTSTEEILGEDERLNETDDLGFKLDQLNIPRIESVSSSSLPASRKTRRKRVLKSLVAVSDVVNGGDGFDVVDGGDGFDVANGVANSRDEHAAPRKHPHTTTKQQLSDHDLLSEEEDQPAPGRLVDNDGPGSRLLHNNFAVSSVESDESHLGDGDDSDSDEIIDRQHNVMWDSDSDSEYANCSSEQNSKHLEIEKEENNKFKRGRVLLEIYESEQVYYGLLQEFSFVFLQQLIGDSSVVGKDFNGRSDLVALCAATQQLAAQSRQFLGELRHEVELVARTIRSGGGDITAVEQYFGQNDDDNTFSSSSPPSKESLDDLTRIVSLASAGSVFCRHARLLHVYEQYAASYGFSNSDVKELMVNPSFTKFWRERSTRPEGFSFNRRTSSVVVGASTTSRRPSLEGYLILAIQRVPRYSLLLAELIKSTPPSMENDLRLLNLAASDIDSVAFGMNEAIRRSEHSQELEALQKKFIGGVVDLVGGLDANHSRWLVREGELMRMCRKSGKAFHFHLFNDTLLYSEKTALGFKLHRALPIDSSFSVSSVAAYYRPSSSRQVHPGIANSTGSSNGIFLAPGTSSGADTSQRSMTNEARSPSARKRSIAHAFEIKTPIKSFVVYAETLEIKEAWLHDLMAVQAHQRQRQSKLCDGPPDTVAPVWQSEGSSSICSICAVKFTFLRRKHHCRRCGVLVCDSCSDRKRIIRITEPDPVRVCDVCKVEMDFTPVSSSPHQHRMMIRVDAAAFAPAPPSACSKARNSSDKTEQAPSQSDLKSLAKKMYFWLTTTPSLRGGGGGSGASISGGNGTTDLNSVAADSRSEIGSVASNSTRNTNNEAAALEQFSLHIARTNGLSETEHLDNSYGGSFSTSQANVNTHLSPSRGPSTVGKLQAESFFSINIGDLLEKGLSSNATLHCMAVGVGHVGEVKISFSRLLRENPDLVKGKSVTQNHSFILHSPTCAKESRKGQQEPIVQHCFRVSLVLMFRLQAPPLLWATNALLDAVPMDSTATPTDPSATNAEATNAKPSTTESTTADNEKHVFNPKMLRLQVDNLDFVGGSSPISPSAFSMSSSGSSLNPGAGNPVQGFAASFSEDAWNSHPQSSRHHRSSSGASSNPGCVSPGPSSPKSGNLKPVPECLGSKQLTPASQCDQLSPSVGQRSQLAPNLHVESVHQEATGLEQESSSHKHGEIRETVDAQRTENSRTQGDDSVLSAAARFAGMRRPRASSFSTRGMVANNGMSTKQQITQEQKQWEQRALAMVHERRNRFKNMRPSTRVRQKDVPLSELPINLQWLSQVAQYCLALSHPSRWAVHSVTALFHQVLDVLAERSDAIHLRDDLEKRLAVFQAEVVIKRNSTKEFARALRESADAGLGAPRRSRRGSLVKSKVTKSKAFSEANHKAPRLLVLQNLLLTEQQYIDSMQTFDLVFVQPLLEIAHGAKLHINGTKSPRNAAIELLEKNNTSNTDGSVPPLNITKVISPKSTPVSVPGQIPSLNLHGDSQVQATAPLTIPTMVRGSSDSGVWVRSLAQRGERSMKEPSSKGVRVQEQSRFRKRVDMLSAAIQIKVPRGTNKTKAVAEMVRQPGITLFLESVRQIITINTDFYTCLTELVADKLKSLHSIDLGDTFERFLNIINAYEVYFAFVQTFAETSMPLGSLEASASAAIQGGSMNVKQSKMSRGMAKLKAVGLFRQFSNSSTQESQSTGQTRVRSDSVASTSSTSSGAGSHSASRDLAELLLSLEQDPRCLGRSLRDFIELPLQRVEWYVVALETLVETTTSKHRDVGKLVRCLHRFRRCVSEWKLRTKVEQ